MSAGLVAGVSAAGAAGAAARYGLETAFSAYRPYPVLAVNVSGSLLLGVLTGLVLHAGAPDALRVVLGTGFCGGYTTFSTTSLVTVRLLQDGARRLAALSGLGTLVLSTLAAAAGLALTGR